MTDPVLSLRRVDGYLELRVVRDHRFPGVWSLMDEDRPGHFLPLVAFSKTATTVTFLFDDLRLTN